MAAIPSLKDLPALETAWSKHPHPTPRPQEIVVVAPPEGAAASLTARGPAQPRQRPAKRGTPTAQPCSRRKT